MYFIRKVFNIEAISRNNIVNVKNWVCDVKLHVHDLLFAFLLACHFLLAACGFIFFFNCILEKIMYIFVLKHWLVTHFWQTMSNEGEPTVKPIAMALPKMSRKRQCRLQMFEKMMGQLHYH